MTIVEKRKRYHSPLGIEEGSFLIISSPQITQYIAVLLLLVTPDIEHDRQQDDASERDEMRQLKRQSIQVIALEIDIAWEEQEITCNNQPENLACSDHNCRS